MALTHTDPDTDSGTYHHDWIVMDRLPNGDGALGGAIAAWVIGVCAIVALVIWCV